MRESNNPPKNTRSEVDLAQMVIRVAQAAQADAIICATETGALAQRLQGLSEQGRVIVATTNDDTYRALTRTGLEAVHLPLHAADRYGQVRYVISVALKSTGVSIGDLVVCAIDRDLYPEVGDLVVLTDVEASLEDLAVSDLIKLTDGIRPEVLEAAITVSCKIGQAARRGKRIGAIFMLGDSLKVLEDSEQLIPNPFQGHDESTRQLTNPDIHEALVELSKLDGAFVVRGDGLIQTAGAFLTSPHAEIDLPAGLGARHTAAAAVTKRTAATAVVVSATDGRVRAYSRGRLVLKMDPDISPVPPTMAENVDRAVRK
jgi:DNA integrity scanning protein DisA with diadenylate cyclase activity